MKFFKMFDLIFWSRFLIMGIGLGLIAFYTIDNMLGRGWIAGYSLAIGFSKLQEYANESDGGKK